MVVQRHVRAGRSQEVDGKLYATSPAQEQAHAARLKLEIVPADPLEGAGVKPRTPTDQSSAATAIGCAREGAPA
jgi:hypothetical protein